MKRKTYLFLLAVLTGSLTAAAQTRTAYFMDQTAIRTSLNPAFQTERDYYTIPLLGNFSVSTQTNGLALDDLVYPHGGGVYTFMSPYVGAGDFLSKINATNLAGMDFRTDILSAGVHAKGAFWTAGIALRGSGYMKVPKSMFELMKTAKDADVSDLKAEGSAWLEIALGYSRELNERLTVGGKVKILPALGGFRVNLDRLQAKISDQSWQISSSADMYLSGLNTKTDAKKGYIDGAEISPGLAGLGAAVDLGVSYRLLDRLTVSGSVLDLGFISYSGATYAKANSSFSFDGFDLPSGDQPLETPIGDQVDALKDDLLALGHFKEQGEKSYTSTLSTTILAGAEYAFLDNRLSAGLLGSARVNPYNVVTEITLSANYRPINWFAATLSYSAVHSGFKTCGLALNYSPRGFNFFIGSDYLISKTTPQGLPVKTGTANFHLGMSVWL